jgi:hypothetical protein
LRERQARPLITYLPLRSLCPSLTKISRMSKLFKFIGYNRYLKGRSKNGQERKRMYRVHQVWEVEDSSSAATVCTS